VLPRDIGKTAGDVRSASEDNTFASGTDRRQSGTDTVPTIEKGGEPSLGNRLAGCCDKPLEPAGAHVTTRVRRTSEHYRTAGSHSHSQGGDRLSKRVDNDDRIAQLCR